jgi:hypothetical protein
LDDELSSGVYRWVVVTDGVLVPTPLADEAAATVRPKRRWLGRR